MGPDLKGLWIELIYNAPDMEGLGLTAARHIFEQVPDLA